MFLMANRMPRCSLAFQFVVEMVQVEVWIGISAPFRDIS
jgi:hypothetical protein